MTFRYGLIDLMLIVTTISIYIPAFMWGSQNLNEIPKGLMIAGGSVLFLGRLFQVCCGWAIHERIERVHCWIWLSLTVIGMVAIALPLG